MFGAFIGALMFIIVPPAVDCVLYPDTCVKKIEKHVGYIKGNYTAIYNKIFDNNEENNINDLEEQNFQIDL